MIFIGFNIEVEYKKILYHGHETRYTITNIGFVINDDTGRIQIPYTSNRGYLIVNLSYKGKRKKVSIHRLVATYFLDNPNNLPEVNHKDGNKNNNSVTNLEWCTPQQNVIHSFDYHLNHSGEDNKLSKITNNQAMKICKYLEENVLTMTEIAEEVGTTRKTVSHIKNKESWTRVSKYYNIDNYSIKDKNVLYADNHPRSKIKSTDVKKICEMIEDNKLTLREISQKTGVSYQIVRNIYYKTTWKSISKNYNFNLYNKDGRKH